MGSFLFPAKLITKKVKMVYRKKYGGRYRKKRKYSSDRMFIDFIIFIFSLIKKIDKKIISSNTGISRLGIGGYYVAKETFFTRSEKTFFDILEKENNGKYKILSKVRMEDIVSVTKEAPFGKRNHIRSRHLDFVLLENNRIICAIEVDGSSHGPSASKKQRDSDQIKNEILGAVGIKLYRVKVGSDFYEEAREIIKS